MAKTLVRVHGPIVLLLLGFGALYATTLDSHGMFVWDEAEYASLARSVARGEGFTISGIPNPLRPPMLPLAAAASMALCQSRRDLVLKLPILLLGLGALFVVHRCVTVQYGHLTGGVATALLGLFPEFWRSTTYLLTEIPYMAFFTGAVVFFYRGLYRSRRYFYWSWLCWGLAALTRYTAVLFAPIVLVFLLVAWVSRHPDAARNVWSKDFALGPLVGGALLGPWLVRQQLTFGDALIGFKQAATQLQMFVPGVSMPWYFYAVQIPAMTSLVPAALLGLGLWWAVRTRDRFALHCLLVSLGILAWFSCYRFKELRQVTSALPFLAIVASLGATKPFMSGPRRRWWLLPTVVLGAVLAIHSLQVRNEITRTVALGYPSFARAMQFVRDHSAAQAVLVGASSPQIHWYTDRRVIDFPDGGELRSVLERSEWVIVNNFERAQPAYARNLLAKVSRDDIKAGDAVVFMDPTFFTVLIRSRLLRERL